MKRRSKKPKKGGHTGKIGRHTHGMGDHTGDICRYGKECCTGPISRHAKVPSEGKSGGY